MAATASNTNGQVGKPKEPTASSGIPSIQFKSAADINTYFQEKFGVDFPTWFNNNHAAKGWWGKFGLDSSGNFVPFNDSKAKKNTYSKTLEKPESWTKIWNNISVVFERDYCNLVEFLAINSIIINETGGDFSSKSEGVNKLENSVPGIAYAWSDNNATKKSYNEDDDTFNTNGVRTNKSTFDLFNDPDYISAHGHLKYNKYKNTNDTKWKGGSKSNRQWPANPSEADTSSSFLSEADFFKFRGRGYIQLTGRSNYFKVIDFVLNYNGENSTILKYKNKWAPLGSNKDKIATQSTNADWDDLFQNSDNIVNLLSITSHASRTKYQKIDINQSEGAVRSAIETVAKRIAGNGAKLYHKLFVGRVYQQLNEILGKPAEDIPPAAPIESQSSGSGSSSPSSSGSNTNFSPITEGEELSSIGLPNVKGIKNFIKPTIKIPPIKVNMPDKPQGEETKSKLGFTPFVYYEEYQIAERDIVSFTLNSDDILPKIKVVFKDSFNKMSNKLFPLDNSTLKVYIDSRSKNLRPIYMEFKITKFSKLGTKFMIKGTLNVDNFFISRFKTFNGNSWSVTQQFCKESGLGFNSNVKDADDSMAWVQPNKTGEFFLKDVVKKAYRGEEGYVWGYVDFYYNFNYIDVEEQMGMDIGGQIGVQSSGIENQNGFTDTPETTTDLILTNQPTMKNTPNYFDYWKILNTSTKVSLEKGYKNRVKYYDSKEKRFLIFDVQSNTSNSDDKIILKDKPQSEDFYNNNVKTTYMGKLDDDNVHANYNYTAVQNKQNIDDLGKVAMKVRMQSPNFNLYRFQKINVLLDEGPNTVTKPQINKRLSGEWLIVNIKFYKLRDEFVQEITLLKRELELSDDEKRKERIRRQSSYIEGYSGSTNPSATGTSVAGGGVLNQEGPREFSPDMEFTNSKEVDDFFSNFNEKGYTGWFYKEFRNTNNFTTDPINRVGDDPQVSDPDQNQDLAGQNRDDGSSTRGEGFIDKEVWKKIWDSGRIIYNDTREGSKLSPNAFESDSKAYTENLNNGKPSPQGKPIISIPAHTGSIPLLVVFGGVDYADQQWMWNQIPESIKKSHALIISNTNNNGGKFSDVQNAINIATTKAQISEKRVCGFSGGGNEVYQALDAYEWDYCGLIDPSAPSVGVTKNYPQNSVIIWRKNNWSTEYQSTIGEWESIAAKIRQGGGQAYHLEQGLDGPTTTHENMPKTFFNQFYKAPTTQENKDKSQVSEETKSKFNAVEFLALQTTIWSMFSDGMKPEIENRGIQESFADYNTISLNKTAYDNFNDPNYISEFGHHKYANILKNTTNDLWKDNNYPTGFSSGSLEDEISIDNNQFVTNADFYKFRLRGWTGTLGRNNYKKILKFIKTYQGGNSIIKEYQNKWFSEELELQENTGSAQAITASNTYQYTYTPSTSGGVITIDVDNNAGLDTYGKTFSTLSYTVTEALDIVEQQQENFDVNENGILYPKAGTQLLNTEEENATDALDKILTISSSDDWDKLFNESDYVIPIVSISNFMFDNSGVHIIDATRSEDKYMKSVNNIGRIVAQNFRLGENFANKLTTRVKDQITWLEENPVSAVFGGDGGSNPVIQKGAATDISNLQPGDAGDGTSLFEIGSRFGKGKVETVIFENVLLSVKVAPYAITMIQAARADGVNLQLTSGFRTNSDQFVNGRRKGGQNHFWDIYQHTKGKHYAYKKGFQAKPHNPNNPPISREGNLAARPGRSNHQNGIAIDLSPTKQGTDGYAWLVRNAWRYGFTRTVKNERWHWEYRPGRRFFDFVPNPGNLWDGLPEQFGIA